MLSDDSTLTVGTRGAYSSGDNTTACVAKSTCAGAGSGGGVLVDNFTGSNNWGFVGNGDWHVGVDSGNPNNSLEEDSNDAHAFAYYNNPRPHYPLTGYWELC